MKNARNEACVQEYLSEHLNSEGHSGILGNVSVTLIDKTNGKYPKRRENYWIRTHKTYVPFELNMEGSVWPFQCRSKNVTRGLTCLIYFGILVRPGTDLGTDFSDMAYIFLYL